jgi:hypothetical protein
MKKCDTYDLGALTLSLSLSPIEGGEGEGREEAGGGKENRR